MGRPNQATKAKRDRERLRLERQQVKREKRSQRNELKKEGRLDEGEGVDPDLIGIVVGPQNLLDRE